MLVCDLVCFVCVTLYCVYISMYSLLIYLYLYSVSFGYIERNRAWPWALFDLSTTSQSTSKLSNTSNFSKYAMVSILICILINSDLIFRKINSLIFKVVSK